MSPPALPDVLYTINARRGEYQDKSEYTVCWTESEAQALAACEHMQIQSNAAHSRLKNNYTNEALDEARLQVGDPMWNAWDHTEYSVGTLTRWCTPSKDP